MSGETALVPLKHSPAPWRWERNWLVDADGNPISRYMEGDARLMAAAPELLQELKDIIDRAAAGEWPLGLVKAGRLIDRIER